MCCGRKPVKRKNYKLKSGLTKRKILQNKSVEPVDKIIPNNVIKIPSTTPYDAPLT